MSATEEWCDELDLLRAAGVRVVPMEDLEEAAIWISSHRILLIAADLTSEERHDLACAYLPTALETERTDQ
ncbi:hypothetical protein ACOACQ_17625 [Nocardioides sp. CPCC 206347]|uniref:hypothetical protein n=1 Tax=Nocardioides sp. CPCC 206347 TaxID=3406463 RepID=UPI003B43A33C